MSLKTDSAVLQKRSGDAETQDTSEGRPKFRTPEGVEVSITALTDEIPYCCNRSAMRWSVLLPATSRVASGASAWVPSCMCSGLASNSPRISMIPSPVNVLWEHFDGAERNQGGEPNLSNEAVQRLSILL